MKKINYDLYPKIKDKIGHLEIISLPFSEKYNGRFRIYLNCKCECGKEKKLSADYLKNCSEKISCGCKSSKYRSNSARFKRGIGTILSEDGKKKCCSCGIEKDRNDFTINNNLKDKLSSRCKNCLSDQARDRRYKMSKEEYLRMIGLQNNRCRCCKEKFGKNKRICIDHCHATGLVRGILCSWCNSGLGHFKDNIEKLNLAIEYLKNNHSHQRK